MNKLVFFLVPISILLSCSIDTKEDLPDPKLVNAERIKNVAIDKDHIRFTVVATVPQPCYEYDSSEIEDANEVVSVKIYAQRLTNDPCPDMLSSIEALINVPVEAGRTYLFQFWKYNNATLDTTITIP